MHHSELRWSFCRVIFDLLPVSTVDFGSTTTTHSTPYTVYTTTTTTSDTTRSIWFEEDEVNARKMEQCPLVDLLGFLVALPAILLQQ